MFPVYVQRHNHSRTCLNGISEFFHITSQLLLYVHNMNHELDHNQNDSTCPQPIPRIPHSARQQQVEGITRPKYRLSIINDLKTFRPEIYLWLFGKEGQFSPHRISKAESRNKLQNQNSRLHGIEYRVLHFYRNTQKNQPKHIYVFDIYCFNVTITTQKMSCRTNLN